MHRRSALHEPPRPSHILQLGARKPPLRVHTIELRAGQVTGPDHGIKHRVGQPTGPINPIELRVSQTPSPGHMKQLREGKLSHPEDLRSMRAGKLPHPRNAFNLKAGPLSDHNLSGRLSRSCHQFLFQGGANIPSTQSRAVQLTCPSSGQRCSVQRTPKVERTIQKDAKFLDRFQKYTVDVQIEGTIAGVHGQIVLRFCKI